MEQNNLLDDQQVVMLANEAVKLALYKKKVTKSPIVPTRSGLSRTALSTSPLLPAAVPAVPFTPTTWLQVLLPTV